MSKMDQLLNSVATITALEASSAALLSIERTLCTRLAFSQGMGWTDQTADVSRRLTLVTGLREALTIEIVQIRERESLQILGRSTVAG
jgi:hypothetical protein